MEVEVEVEEDVDSWRAGNQAPASIGMATWQRFVPSAAAALPRSWQLDPRILLLLALLLPNSYTNSNDHWQRLLEFSQTSLIRHSRAKCSHNNPGPHDLATSGDFDFDTIILWRSISLSLACTVSCYIVSSFSLLWTVQHC